jgi:predicted CoA-binding protein
VIFHIVSVVLYDPKVEVLVFRNNDLYHFRELIIIIFVAQKNYRMQVISPLTLVLGASPDPSRYSYLAMQRLRQHGFDVHAFGLRKGRVEDVEIGTDAKALPSTGVDTVTLYLGAPRQKEYYSYLLKLKPRRIIFNPGAENEELKTLAEDEGILCEEACTLVLLNLGRY